MNMEKFIEKFESLLEEETPGSINGSTDFKKLGEWSSLLSLSLIAMVDEEYDYTLTNDDLKNSTTLSDLFSKIKNEK